MTYTANPIVTRRHLLLVLVGTLSGISFLDGIISLPKTIRPRGIVIHHSALPSDESVADIEKLHTARGFGVFYWTRMYYIGYHYIIRADGQVVSTRPECLRGAHAKGSNDMLGICILGDFDSSAGDAVPTAPQMRALQTLCRSLIAKYRFLDSDVHRHSDVDSYTVCPGDHFPFEQLLASLRG
ncbi:peptidoglycan recognition family protein [Granulicella sp. L46]|uniref:peptidoglycan recognition protein family protein n=1 Tax=Granulicella sp. L46 TaxID=1641865 RepID=UPI00131E9B5D